MGLFTEMRKIKEDRQEYKRILAEERGGARLRASEARSIELREKARAKAEYEAMPLTKKARVLGSRVRERLEKFSEKVS
jgi:hypothetical protein